MAVKKKDESHWYRFNPIIDLCGISILLIVNLNARPCCFP